MVVTTMKGSAVNHVKKKNANKVSNALIMFVRGCQGIKTVLITAD
jgi:hypothetical protein